MYTFFGNSHKNINILNIKKRKLNRITEYLNRNATQNTIFAQVQQCTEHSLLGSLEQRFCTFLVIFFGVLHFSIYLCIRITSLCLLFIGLLAQLVRATDS